MLFSLIEEALAHVIDVIPFIVRALTLAPLFFAGTWAVGVLLLGWSTGIRRRSVLIPGGVLLGFCTASIFLNAAAYAIGWHAAALVWVSFGVWCLTRVRHAQSEIDTDDEDWGSLTRAWRWLIPAIFILGVTSHVFDNVAHFGFQTLMGRGVWPLQFLFEPTQKFIYHYGFDMAAAPLVTFGILAPFGSLIWVMTLQWALVSFAYVAVGGWVHQRATRWWIVAAWALTESMGWLLRPFRAVLPEVFKGLSPFYSLVVHSVFVTTYAKSFLPAFGGMLLMLWWSRSQVPQRARLLIPLFILFTASALSSETIFLSLMPFFALAILISLKDRYARLATFGTLCAMLVAVSLQGGLLSAAVMQRVMPATGSVSQAADTGFHFRNSADLLLFGGEVLNLHSFAGWVRLAFEIGASLVLLVAAFVTWKQWDRFSRCVLLSAIAAMVMALSFVYEGTPVNILRFFGHAFFISGFFGAIILVPILLRHLAGRIVLGLLLIGGIVTLFFYTVASNLPPNYIFSPAQPFTTTPALWPPFVHQAYLPRGSVVWVSEPDNHENFPPPSVAQVPVIFGAYVKSCSTFSTPDLMPDCDTFYTAPNASTLIRLGVTHLLLTTDWIQMHKTDPWFGQLEEVTHYSIPNWAAFTPSWWRDDTREWTLFRVKNL